MRALRNQSPSGGATIPLEILDATVARIRDITQNEGAVRTPQGDEDLRALLAQFYRHGMAERYRPSLHIGRAAHNQNTQQIPQVPPNTLYPQGLQQPDVGISIHYRNRARISEPVHYPTPHYPAFEEAKPGAARHALRIGHPMSK